MAYTRENYTVVYGTDQLNLNHRSTTISGVSGTTSYSVELAQLQHSTRYYFQVQSSNSVGSTNSAVASFEVQNACKQTKITLCPLTYLIIACHVTAISNRLGHYYLSFSALYPQLLSFLSLKMEILNFLGAHSHSPAQLWSWLIILVTLW